MQQNIITYTYQIPCPHLNPLHFLASLPFSLLACFLPLHQLQHQHRQQQEQALLQIPRYRSNCQYPFL